MQDCRFKQLIIDTYKDSKNRTFTKNEFGAILTYNNYFGMLYNVISTDCFSDITDIENYLNMANPDMLLLYSRTNCNELEIYNSRLVDYKIENDKLHVQLRNREVIFDLN